MTSTEGSDWKRHRAIARPAFNKVEFIVHGDISMNKRQLMHSGKQWLCVVRVDS
jgi:hypothetical protein